MPDEPDFQAWLANGPPPRPARPVARPAPGARFILNTGRLGEEQLDPNEKPLDRTVREAFRVRAPLKVTIEELDKYFEAQRNIAGVNFLSDGHNFSDAKNLIGIEVEVENVRAIDPNVLLCCWVMENDGSLRNYGKEFKTVPIPARYSGLAFERLLKGLNKDIDFSKRTSIHVHQDVRGLTLRQVLGLVFTYTVVERLLFKFASPARLGSIYCVPLVHTDLFEDFQSEGQCYGFLRHHRDNWPKYTALNLMNLGTLGTIEYRHMPGTSDIGKLLGWVDLISRLKIWVYRTKFEDILAQIGELNTNSQYQRFVEDVFQEATNYLDLSELQRDMEHGTSVVKNCMVTNPFHQFVVKCGSDMDSVWGSPLGRSFGIVDPIQLAPEVRDLWVKWAQKHFAAEFKKTEQQLFFQVRTRLDVYLDDTAARSGTRWVRVLKMVFGREPFAKIEGINT